MSEALIIFKAINSESDKQRFAQKILTDQETIHLDTKDQQPLLLRPKSIDHENNLYCTTLGTPLSTDVISKVTANIALQGESYMFETRPEISGQDIKLPIFNLFHLQKRKNYRYIIPDDYSAQFVFNKMNGEATSINCRLLDLSTEGCAIEIAIDGANVKLSDKIEGAIFLGHRDQIQTQGYIKNIRPKGDTAVVLGIRFAHLTNTSEGQIIASLADLQREIYFLKAA